MNKNQLIEALAPRLGGRSTAALAVESFVDVVLREVAAGRSVGITGFGTFERVDRAARTGRNPHTGEAVPIAAASRPRFRPGTYFTSVVSEPGLLPATGLAGARIGSSEDAGPAGVEEVGRGDDAATEEDRNGAPPSIRRASPPVEQSRAVEEAPGRRLRPRTSGTPPTVRADRRSSDDEAPSRPPRREPALGGRVMMSGEDITRNMIKAKKAELALAKDDALSPTRSAKGKKSKKRKKKSRQGQKP